MNTIAEPILSCEHGATSVSSSPALGVQLIGLMLALSATVLSVAVAALVGWQRGGTTAEKCLLAAVGLLAVLGAHLLLPLCRSVPMSILSRMMAMVLWLACLAYAALSHVSFFIEAQAQRAEYRMAAVGDPTPDELPAPRRHLSAILEEKAALTARLMQAQLLVAACSTACDASNVRLMTLKARVTALEAEAEEARRWQVMRDQLQQRKEALRDDPIVARLMPALGVTREVASTVSVLPAALILEGLGSLCWLVVFQRRGMRETPNPAPAIGTQVIDGVSAPVSIAETVDPAAPLTPASLSSQVMHDSQASPNRTVGGSVHSFRLDDLAAQVWIEVQAGRVRPTVSGIRDHLQIAQKRAQAIACILRERQRN